MSESSEEEGRRKLSLSRRITREFHRKKEQIRQSVGNVDQTEDRAFDRMYEKLKNHQHGIMKFHKHMLRYQTQLIETCVQNDKVMESMWKMVHPIWEENDEINQKFDMIVHAWHRYIESLKLNVINPLEEYMVELDNLNAKVAKRNRKLLDYDSCRHYLDDLKAGVNLDQAKIQKQIKKTEESCKQYEALNNQVIPQIKDLCGFHSKRVAELLQNFYTEEAKFHSTVGTLYEDLYHLIPTLTVRQETSATSRNSSPSSFESSKASSDSSFKFSEDEAETVNKQTAISVKS